MYPYNRKTQLYSTPIRAKERTTTQTTQTAPLSTDRRLMELLQLAQQETAALAKKYEALLRDEKLAASSEIIHTMQVDEKKHQRILREILFTIFSDTIAELIEEITDFEIETKDTEELLEELLLTEMDDITFFRDLLSAMEDDDLWDLIFEIITDKQNHTAALNHLYAKYFAKTTGQ